MKIGITNFHFAHNYGAVLECVALKKYIESLGHTVEVIDYRPEYIAQQFAVYPNPIEFAKWAKKDFANSGLIYKTYRMLRRALQAVYKYKNVALRKQRMIVFEDFINKNMHLTKCYKTIEQLKKMPPECDVYISGSDQIWNPYVTAGLDPAYFLMYGNENTIRIAYAVSPCQLDVELNADILKEYLNKYDAISLREEEKRNDLENLVEKEIQVCLDPTLLLDAKDYEEFEKIPNELPDDYILVYGFSDRNNPNLLCECVDIVKRKTGLPVINISHDKLILPSDVMCKNAVSPGEFLYYFKNAKYVVTNSFHGTAFSIIYNKEFWSVEKGLTASRMKDIMVKLGLQERMVGIAESNKIPRTMQERIDYSIVATKLQNLRRNSNQYLVDNLSTIKERKKCNRI